MTQAWWKLFGEELHNLFFIKYQGHKLKDDEMKGARSEHGRNKKCAQNFDVKAYSERSLQRPKRT